RLHHPRSARFASFYLALGLVPLVPTARPAWRLPTLVALLRVARADRGDRRGDRRGPDPAPGCLLPGAAAPVERRPPPPRRRRRARDGAGHRTGAAQAIEDAVVLADRLAAGVDVASALAEYEAVRRPRADAVLKMSRRVDKAAQLASPLGSRFR